MKIKKLHIISFGGLKNFTLNFEDGFNCIYGQNESGKTTVMSFIKMMFYGNDKGSSQISKNSRKKYTPWDGSAMSGSIEFELDGRCFKLEREFRSSNSTDKVSLTNLSLGEKELCEPNIGENLFGLTASAFERSLFIGQLGFPESNPNAESEINARLSNMVSTGDETISLEKVTARLEKERYAIISKSGKAGEYYKNSLLAKDVGEKLSHSITANRQYTEAKQKLTEFIAETDEIVKKADVLKAQISREQDIKNGEKLKELLLTKDALENVKQQLTLSDGTPADDNFLRSIKFAISRLNNADNKVTAKEREISLVKSQLDTLINGPKLSPQETPEGLQDDLDGLDKNLTELEALYKENSTRLETLRSKEKDKAYTKASINPFSGLGLILLALGLACISISIIPTLIFVVLGAVFSLIGFSKPKHNKKLVLLQEEINSLERVMNNQAAHIDDIKAQILSKKAKLEAIKLSANANTQLIASTESQLSSLQSEHLELLAEQQQLNANLSGLASKLGGSENPDTALEKLENAAAKQKELKQHIGFLLRDLNNISYEDAEKKLSEIQNSDNAFAVDFESIKKEYETLLSGITERRAKEAAVDTQLKALITGVEVPDVLQSKLNELNEVLTAQKDFCDSADIAVEVLKESFAELRQNYGSQLEKKSAEVFSLLTRGKYLNMTVSKSFGINVEESANPISREAEYLSSGAYDQAYLSMRLAVAELLGGSLPLFLDDTLTQYDDTRAKATLKFLKDFSKESQSIMFTCHKTIYDFADALGCSLNTI